MCIRDRAGGASLASKSGNVNIWVKGGEIRGAKGTQLYLLGEKKTTALQVYSEGGRLFIKETLVSDFRNGVSKDGMVSRSTYTSGQYAVMGKSGLSFRHLESYSNTHQLGYFDTLPAGMKIRILMDMGTGANGKSEAKWVTVTLKGTDPLREPSLGESAGIRSRGINTLSLKGSGGAVLNVDRIGVMSNQSFSAGELYNAEFRRSPNVTLEIDSKADVYKRQPQIKTSPMVN